MDRWEYMLVEWDLSSESTFNAPALNLSGELGWEVAGVVNNTSSNSGEVSTVVTIILKKRKP